jgi:hypothetical protein
MLPDMKDSTRPGSEGRGQIPDGVILLNGGIPVTPSEPIPTTPPKVLQASSGDDRTSRRTGIVPGEFAGLLLGIHELRLRVEADLLAVPEEFKQAFRKSRLRLRAWPRKKGEPPYALYWIVFPPREDYCEDWLKRVVDQMATRRQWFHRVKIRTSRDMDRAIHRAGLDHCRKEVHAFHRLAWSLNEAHKILTGTLDAIRKMLESRAGGRLPDIPSTPPPTLRIPPGLPRDVELVLELLSRLESLIHRRQDECRVLARLARHKPLWQCYRLTFREDAEHPYGRLVWVSEETGQAFSHLDYRKRRRLGLPSRVSRFISPFELQRRKLDRLLKASTSLASRIRQKIPVALRKARAGADAALGERRRFLGMTYDPRSLTWRQAFGL